jgi:hypothetical protein
LFSSSSSSSSFFFLQRFHSDAGMAPESRLEPSFSVLSDGASPSPKGIPPVRLFPDRSRVCSDGSDDRDDGTLPASPAEARAMAMATIPASVPKL